MASRTREFRSLLTVKQGPVIAIESHEAVLNQRVAESISRRGKSVRDGRIYGRIVTVVVAFLQDLQVEDFHHLGTWNTWPRRSQLPYMERSVSLNIYDIGRDRGRWEYGDTFAREREFAHQE